MSLIKLLPAWLHAIADYAVGGLLVAVALIVDMSTEATIAGVVIGATILAVSIFTKYPLGLVKVLSFRLHSAGDYAATVLLLGSPFVLGFNDTDTGVTVLYVGAGIAVALVSLITNYQYGPVAEKAKRGPVAKVAVRPAGTRRIEPLRAAGR